MSTGHLIIISGPSGAGKSTVVGRLLQACELPLTMSVSATTRSPRDNEVDGREYHFVSHERFAQLRATNAFLECKEVFGRGDWYGTLRDQVATGLNEGKWVILEIDVQGALQVLEQIPDAISVFVHPGSMQELERRLRSRGTESEEVVGRRLEVAKQEMALRHHYQYEVINHNLDETVQQICRLLQQHQGETLACSKN